jgi:imidazolonepropionase-like amidohydrolase
MSALPETLRQRHEIESGAVLGPHIAAAAMLDGDPPVWQLNARVATTPEQGRRAVRDIAAAGYAFVKIYTRLEMPVFQAVIEEARAVGLPVIGHVPAGSRGRAEDVLVPGFAMVVHAEEFAKLDRESGDPIRPYAQLARRSGTWITSTLTTNDWIARQTRDPSIVSSARGIEHVHPAVTGQWLHANRYAANFSQELAERREHLVKYTQRLVRIFSDEGVPIMPGTDSIVPGVVYGFSLHDELELLAAAGIGNQRVLESATRLPAEFLGVADDRGTIEVGKMADFILLTANPLDDIRNTRAIAGVSIRGRYLPHAELDLLMRELARRYREMQPVMRP